MLSPSGYNALGWFDGVLSADFANQGYPFEVLLVSQQGSAVLADQVKNLDWRARRATRKGRVTHAELRQVRAKLRALIGQALTLWRLSPLAGASHHPRRAYLPRRLSADNTNSESIFPRHFAHVAEYLHDDRD